MLVSQPKLLSEDAKMSTLFALGAQERHTYYVGVCHCDRHAPYSVGIKLNNNAFNTSVKWFHHMI